jgi:8-oxo-dGTP diphosphatase
MASISTAGIASRKGKYFIARRNPGSSIGERWEFPGGKAEAGESPEEALRREFLEEFNVAVEVGDLVTTGRFTNKGREYILYAYAVVLKGEPAPVEHQDMRWAPLEEMGELDFPESDRQIIKALQVVFPEKK